MDIYQNKSRFKIGFVIVALLLGTASLIYTTLLVNSLAKRERKTIDLFAKAQRFVANVDSGDDLTFLLQEIIQGNESIPVILVRGDAIINHRNISIPENASEERKQKILQRELALMKEEYEPIKINVAEDTTENLIYYRNSDVLYQLRYYPYIQIVVLLIFGFLTYLAFSFSKRAEQNRVWVGLAKETAHQLGTPISSLMAWIDYMRVDEDFDRKEMILELDKDVKRLERVVARFSNIGSEPTLQEEDIYFVVLGVVNYLKRRISTKVELTIDNQLPQDKKIQVNRYLFEWVIENLSNNAVDAMGSKGKLSLVLSEMPEGNVQIDVTDTGKGMTSSQISKVFRPGFTTKKRGWGLGLTLTKRIIENYHKGKISVAHSEPGVGTTFRIVLKG